MYENANRTKRSNVNAFLSNYKASLIGKGLSEKEANKRVKQLRCKIIRRCQAKKQAQLRRQVKHEALCIENEILRKEVLLPNPQPQNKPFKEYLKEAIICVVLSAMLSVVLKIFALGIMAAQLSPEEQKALVITQITELITPGAQGKLDTSKITEQ